MSESPNIISAICTPLNADDSLSVDGVAAHLEEHASAGIPSLLVAGTMGLMPLLTECTYRELVEETVRLGKDRFELLVGVGDTSFARTRDRIAMVDQLAIDGVVVLTPYFISYRAEELVDYYEALADESRRPVYLYTNPVVTGAQLEIETVTKVARHPNIRGIKCACEFEWTQRLIHAIEDEGFRIIVAQPESLELLLRAGVKEHLDGIFAIVPHWTMALVNAAQRGDWKSATQYQSLISDLFSLVSNKYPTYAAAMEILNAQGVPGTVGPAPIRRLTLEERTGLLNEPTVIELLARRQFGHLKSKHSTPKTGAGHANYGHP